MVFNRKFIFISGILLILGILIPFKIYKDRQTLKPLPQAIQLVEGAPEVHYHAGFVVFDNGVKVDFSVIKYMNISPCTEHAVKVDETPEHLQMEKAHLHDGVGDVVHSHREGARWGDLFTNIGYPIDYSKVTAFINGVEIQDIQNASIVGDDSVVIFVGEVDKTKLIEAITINHIKEVEKMSENCGGQS